MVLVSNKKKFQKAAGIISKKIGEHNVIDDPDILAGLAGDESTMPVCIPDFAIRVHSTADIALVLKEAYEADVPVVPRAGGTGKAGGAIPVTGCFVLDTSKMKKILEIDTDNLVATAECGVVTGDFHAAVEKEGLFYPPDPNSLETCCLGGNVAHNAGGPRAFKYGVTRNYIMGMDVVLMGGEVLSIGRNTVKSSAGYDLTGTMVGSEGTLAVFSRLKIALIHNPLHIVTALILFPDETSAGKATAKITSSGLRPRVLEFLDRELVKIIRLSGVDMVPEKTEALLLVEFDGENETVTETELDRLAEICEKEGASNVLTAKHGGDREKLWSARRVMSDAIKSRAKHKISEDIAVPRSQIPYLLTALKNLSDKNNVLIASYGHAGDGNFHVNILWDDELFEPEPTVEQVFKIAVSLGGTITGEHGVGLAKRKYLPLEKTPAQIAWMKRIKQLFDPKDLLNPGKIF